MEFSNMLSTINLLSYYIMPPRIMMQISNTKFNRPVQPRVVAPAVKMNLGGMSMISRLSNSVPCGSCGK